MKRVVYGSVSLRKAFLKFLVVIALLSALGGYQLSQLISKTNESSAQRSVLLLEIEEHLDDAAIDLARQVQEWKDMLLRAEDKELYGKHLAAFKEASIDVQYALLSAKQAMEAMGMDTGPIDHLMAEHKSVLSEYLAAYSKLDSRNEGSAGAVDKRIMGVDRGLQRDIAAVKDGISGFAREQLSGALYAESGRYLMWGLLGTVCLFFMALAGFGFAFHLMRE
jgi:methyl-accepting chemotaxis protein